MPIHDEQAAPTFDRTKPHELLTFFAKYESLFNRTTITSEVQKKRDLLHYVDFDTEQCWKSLPEYSNATASYRDFKEAILIVYPIVYSLRDMELLISDTQKVNISTTSQLSKYHTQYLAITSWLIKEDQLDKFTQKRSYIKAFQPSLSFAISQRLQIKLPNHRPHAPYPVSDVYDTAQYILQGASPCISLAAPPLPVAPSAIETNNLRPPFLDITRNIISNSSITSSNLASTVSHSNEPVCYSQDRSISSVTQSARSTLPDDRINVEHKSEPQRPSAIPIMSTTSTSIPAIAQSSACSLKAPISVSSHSEPIYQSPTVYQSSIIPQIQESELDMPITLSLMALPSDIRTEIQNLIAARKTSVPSATLVASVTSPLSYEHDRITVLKNELPILRVKEQDIASNICTSAQKEGETCVEISDNKSPTNAPIIAKCTEASTAYFASLPIYKAPLVEITEPESNIVHTRPIESNILSPQPALLRQSHKSESAAMHIGLAPSATFAPFAPSSSFIPASTACKSESVFSSVPSSLSITTRIITDDQPLQLAARGMHQHSIASESLALSPINSLQPVHFSYPSNSSFSSGFNLYIASPNEFLHLAAKYMPKYFFPIDIIAYPPCNSLQLAHFNLL